MVKLSPSILSSFVSIKLGQSLRINLDKDFSFFFGFHKWPAKEGRTLSTLKNSFHLSGKEKEICDAIGGEKNWGQKTSIVSNPILLSNHWADKKKWLDGSSFEIWPLSLNRQGVRKLFRKRNLSLLFSLFEFDSLRFLSLLSSSKSFSRKNWSFFRLDENVDSSRRRILRTRFPFEWTYQIVRGKGNSQDAT